MKIKNILKSFSLLLIISLAIFSISAIVKVNATPTYETPDNISISDLKQSNKSIGNKIVCSSKKSYSYNKTAKFGSIIFTFNYKFNEESTTGDHGNQIHIGKDGYTNDYFWIRPDNLILYSADIEGSYIKKAPFDHEEHKIEIGKLALVENDQCVGYYFYIKVDDSSPIIEYNTTSKNVESDGYIDITGSTKNLFTDINWNGDTVTYKCSGETVKQETTFADYLTEPSQSIVTVPSGKKFIGWFDDMGHKWDFSKDVVNGNLTLTAGFESETALDDSYFSDENFTPVIRFSLSSDVHIKEESTARNAYLAKLFEVAYQYANSSTKYNKLDASLFAGDISDSGNEIELASFKTIVDNNIQSGTALLVTMGNHDYRGASADEAVENFEKYFTNVDFTVVINGFYFICISPDIKEGEDFSQSKVDWLESQLEIAAEADPNKPIFVMQHEHIKDTVYGSKDWGVTAFTDLLCKYPQVVDFSGHSHYPLADPRSVWQGTFTALGTGTLKFYEMGIVNYKSCGVYPNDLKGGWSTAYSTVADAAEFQIVELDASNNMRVIVYDLINDCEIKRMYFSNLLEERKITYSHEERESVSAAPVFGENEQATATVFENNITLKFKQATCSTDFVDSYRIEIYSYGSLVDTRYALSGYYRQSSMPEYIEIDIKYLQDTTPYTFKIYAVNVWGIQSSSYLMVKATTEESPDYPDNIQELSLKDLYSAGSGSQLSTSSINGYIPAYFKVNEDNKYGSFKIVLQLLYMGEDFQFLFNEEFNNSDLVWINREDGKNIWFIGDNYSSSEPVSVGLHTIEYGRYHITKAIEEKENNPKIKKGYTAFYIKLDGELVYTCYSSRAFTTNGMFAFNFGGCYKAGSRYYDISAEITKYDTPTFTNKNNITLDTHITNWSSLGGELTFASTSPSLTFYLKDANGIVSREKTFNGSFKLGKNGNYYLYKVKTNSFEIAEGATGQESIIEICCNEQNWKCANLVETVYGPEVRDDKTDLVNVKDLVLSTTNTGVIDYSSTEKPYLYEGKSEHYSAVFKYYLVTGDLGSECEFRTQLGTIWTYHCCIWLKPGDLTTAYFSWQYSTNPSDKYSVNIEKFKRYLIETGAIYIVDGEWKDYYYVYFKINGVQIAGFYAPSDECVSGDYCVSYKIKDGYILGDVSLGRTITFMNGSTVHKTFETVNGAPIFEPEDPTMPGKYFIGWFTAETGGERVDFSKKVNSEDENVTYYARYSDTPHTVTFYSDEAGSVTYKTFIVGEGGYIKEFSSPIKTGTYKYTFVKWVDVNTNEEFNFSQEILKDYTLKPIFEEKKYTIYFYVDGVVYATRTFVESDPTFDVPAVPYFKGSTGYWLYSSDTIKADKYAVAKYNGVDLTQTTGIELNKFNGSTVDIADFLTRYYLSISDTEDQAEWLENYPVTGGHERQDITFSWTDKTANKSYLVYFADNEDFTNAFIVQTQTKSINYVGIFEPGKTYYWRVVGLTNDECSITDSFTVLDSAVRWISAGTVYNMRDIGGWTTEDGEYAIRYGLIYRGGQLSIDQTGERSEMNDYSHKVFDYLYFTDSEGTTHYGIKTEIELRGDKPHELNQINPLEEVINVNGTGYLDYFKLNDNHKADYRKVFEELADISNYPFYFHCSWGADRTGSLGFLINAVLGVPYEQLVEDYELTSLSHSGVRTRYGYDGGKFSQMYEKMMETYGKDKTIQEAVYTYLTSYVGVKAEHITALRNIMLVQKSSSTLAKHNVKYLIGNEVYQELEVFDGTQTNGFTPMYFDKHVAYWALPNGEAFDITTPVTTDLVLTAVFEKSVYEEYDVISLRELGLEDAVQVSLLPNKQYEGISSTGSRMFVFDYEIIAKVGNNEVAFEDGLHIEFGPEIWRCKAHVQFISTVKQMFFTQGVSKDAQGNEQMILTSELAYNFEYGKTYRIETGVVIPTFGENAGKKMIIIMINGDVIGYEFTTADLSLYSLSFAGTQGIMHNVEVKHEVVFKENAYLVGKTLSVSRGSLIEAIEEPTKAGKVFLGWYDELGNKWNFNTDKVLKDVTLTAKFGDKTVSAVLVDSNGIEIRHGYEVKVGLLVSNIETPTLSIDGLEFDGWYDGERRLSDNDKITESMNLICKFKVVDTKPITPSKKGCGSSITALSISLLSSLCALAFINLKRRFK